MAKRMTPQEAASAWLRQNSERLLETPAERAERLARIRAGRSGRVTHQELVEASYQRHFEEAQEKRRRRDEERVENAPTYTQAIIGYRRWAVDAYHHLGASSVGGHWTPGANVASCDKAKGYVAGELLRDPHESPHPDCHCGLYAWHDPATFDKLWPFDIQGRTWVKGAIAAWGRIEAHHHGFRAEKARVVALRLPDEPTDDDRYLYDQLSRRYDVPAVPAAMLQLEAERHGASVPEAERPPLPEPPKEISGTGYASATGYLISRSASWSSSSTIVYPPHGPAGQTWTYTQNPDGTYNVTVV